jgi:hypothetical protein
MNNNPLNNSVSVPVAVPVVTYSNASTDKARISCLKISSYMSAASMPRKPEGSGRPCQAMRSRIF